MSVLFCLREVFIKYKSPLTNLNQRAFSLYRIFQWKLFYLLILKAVQNELSISNIAGIIFIIEIYIIILKLIPPLPPMPLS